MLWTKKNSYKEFDNEKKIPAARKFPTRTHNFSNGPSLRWRWCSIQQRGAKNSERIQAAKRLHQSNKNGKWLGPSIRYQRQEK